MIIRIQDGTEVLATNEIVLEEGQDLFLPRSIKRLEAGCVTTSSVGVLRDSQTIHFDGTAEEWGKIIKGSCEWKADEDWYGYYYHNTDRYEVYLAYIPFWNTNRIFKVKVICKDGEFSAGMREADDKEDCFRYMCEHNLISETAPQ